MRDKLKEEELRSSGDPVHEHLNDALHVLIEAVPPHATQKLAAGVAEVRKMLIPVVSGQVFCVCSHCFCTDYTNFMYGDEFV